MKSGLSLPQDAQLNAASPILRLTRSGETAWGPLPGGDWTIFQANHSTYEPLAWAHRDSLDYPANRSPLATVIQVRLDFIELSVLNEGVTRKITCITMKML